MNQPNVNPNQGGNPPNPNQGGNQQNQQVQQAQVQQAQVPNQNQQQQQQVPPQVQVVAPPVIVKKSLSKWDVVGLDLSDAGFSKLHARESKYSETKPKYNLEPEKFEIYKEELVQKVHRMHALECMSVRDDGGNVCEVLKEYTKLTRDNVEAEAVNRWPNMDPPFNTQREADMFTDEQLKASTIGNWIHESLTDDAVKQLKADQAFFEVMDSDGNPYYDGASYFYAIAELVDPDNGHLIETVRKQLRTLNVRDFGFSVIKM